MATAFSCGIYVTWVIRDVTFYSACGIPDAVFHRMSNEKVPFMVFRSLFSNSKVNSFCYKNISAENRLFLGYRFVMSKPVTISHVPYQGYVHATLWHNDTC